MSVSSGAVSRQHQRIKIAEPQAQASHVQVYESDGFEGAGHHEEISDGGKGGANGAELASLAHSGAIQAHNAVRKQHTEGSQAAFGIKSSLASAASGVSIYKLSYFY